MDDWEKNTVTPFKQALGNAKLTILSLLIAFIMSMGLNFYLGFCLYKVPSQQSLYVPPNIPLSGLTLKAGKTSNSQVYAFAYYIWQSLQTWPVNGFKDYKDNIDKFSPYITPGFKNVLENQGKQLYNKGFLYGHQQATFGANGSLYNPKNVRYVGHSTWLVHLDMRTINRVMPPNGSSAFEGSHVVRDAETSFVFRVVRYDYAPDQNHWHLAIAGFAVEPKVVKIYK